jgi:hypothetical protein
MERLRGVLYRAARAEGTDGVEPTISSPKAIHHRQRSYSVDTQEWIAEMQRHAVEPADRPLKSLFQETEPRGKGKQLRAKPKRRKW